MTFLYRVIVGGENPGLPYSYYLEMLRGLKELAPAVHIQAFTASEIVYLSGLAEMVLGAAVLIPALRVVAAWGIIALLMAILPANIHIALHDVPLGGAAQGAGIWNWVRLPFQGVFIAWAWWYTRAERYRNIVEVPRALLRS